MFSLMAVRPPKARKILRVRKKNFAGNCQESRVVARFLFEYSNTFTRVVTAKIGLSGSVHSDSVPVNV